MSAAAITRLTPPGAAALATLEFRGVDAWPRLREQLETVRGGPLPLQVPPGWATLARVRELGEEAVLVCREAHPEGRFELHLHGGEQLIAWLMERFTGVGLQTATPPQAALQHAPTLPLARILLAQRQGAFRGAVAELETLLAEERWYELEARVQRLCGLAIAGQHLTRPFRVAVVGAPNVGKSALANALLGYQRSVVADIPGTTRDVVSTRLALDGWLIELTDTAGLRQAFDPLEREGIDRAQKLLRDVDLCLWVLDSTAQPFGPTLKLVERTGLPRETLLFVLNKCDRSATWDIRELPQAVRVSATTGMGIGTLCERILARLLPVRPQGLEAVPLRAETQQQLRQVLAAVIARETTLLQHYLQALRTFEESA